MVIKLMADISKTNPSGKHGCLDRLLMAFDTPMRFCFFGLAFAHCWIFSIQRSISDSTSDYFPPFLFLGISISCLLSFAIAKSLKRNVSTSPAYIVAVITLGLASTFLLVDGISEHLDFSVEIALALTCGMAIGGSYVMWGDFYARLNVRQTLFILFCSIILGSAMKILFQLFRPSLSSAVLYSTLPLLSFAFWRQAEKNPPNHFGAPESLSPSSKTILRYYALGVATFGIAIGIVRSLDIGYFSPTFLSGSISHLLEIAISIWIILMVYRQHEELEFSTMWMFVLIVLATGLLVLEFSTDMIGALAASLLTAAQMLVVVFYWFALSDIAQSSKLTSDVVFGLGWPIYTLPMALASLFMLKSDWGDQRLSIVIVYALLISVFFFMRKRPYDKPVLFNGLYLSSPSDPDTLSKQVASAAARFGLSEREQEIALLYAQGRSRIFISEKLFISENTTRDHITHIYRKMGIHNKQDFINILQKQ